MSQTPERRSYLEQLKHDAWIEFKREVRNPKGWTLDVQLRRNRVPLIVFTHEDGRTARLWDLYVTADGHIQNCNIVWKQPQSS